MGPEFCGVGPCFQLTIFVRRMKLLMSEDRFVPKLVAKLILRF